MKIDVKNIPTQVSFNHIKYDWYLKDGDLVFTPEKSTSKDICIIVNINLDNDGYLFFQVIYMETLATVSLSSHKNTVALHGLKKTIETAVWDN
jgi:hypothetical protein